MLSVGHSRSVALKYTDQLNTTIYMLRQVINDALRCHMLGVAVPRLPFSHALASA